MVILFRLGSGAYPFDLLGKAQRALDLRVDNWLELRTPSAVRTIAIKASLAQKLL
jgi:hypothetical protein